MSIKLRQIGDFLWEIPKEGRMHVPGRVYLAPEQVAEVRKDKALEQVKNVAHLPGIVGYSLAMPDIHWGYGFPIGGVAAVDVEDGAVSPGGVGFDVNCLAGETPVLHELGYHRPISDLVESRAEVPLRVFDEANRIFDQAHVVAGKAGPPARPVLELTTSSGRKLVATADHPVLTPDGMVEVGMLGPGSRIASVGFEGVPYDPADDEIIVDEARLRLVAETIGKTNTGHAVDQAISALAPLLPLRRNHPAMGVLAKVCGYVLGDGSVYFEKRGRKGRVVAYGKPDDLNAMARDLRPWLGVCRVYRRQRHHRFETAYGECRFEAEESCLKIGSTGVVLLMAALGIPVGNKTTQDWYLPDWLEGAPRWQQRLFLAGLFGAELTTPDAFVKRGHNFKCPVLSMNKRSDRVESGRRFLAGLAVLLRDFGVTVLTVSERDEHICKDGSLSVRLRLVVSSKAEDLIALWGRIGFAYNTRRAREACRAVQYLREKQQALAARQQARDRVVDIRQRTGWGATRIMAAVGDDIAVNKRFVERCLYGGQTRTPRVGDEFPTFEQWSDDACDGLGDSGATWDTIVAIEERSDVDIVYDLTVDSADHNFVAGGFVVHNCGVRVITTELNAGELKPHVKKLVQQLFEAVPTGVGASKAIKGLSDAQLRDVMTDGAQWAVDEGFYAGEDDAERCEEGGRLRGADPDAVSDRAYRRGRDQVGTLGSGNHFLEVQRVDEIFDEEAAEAFGLYKGQVTLMIHSGSRGLGHQVCDETTHRLARRFEKFGPDYAAIPDRQLACAPIGSAEGQEYLGAMQAAANFAWANRQVMTGLAVEALADTLGLPRDRLGARLLYDVCHNIAKIEEHRFAGTSRRVLVHRKVATRAFGPGDARVPEPYRRIGQPVMIPGDMGRYSYVLAGNAGAMEGTFGSSCHGAGRVLSRTAARKKAKGRRIDLEMKKAGIEVRSKGYRTLAEEMSEAYKDVADVVDVIDGAGVSRKVARLVPLGVIKG